MGHAAGPCWQFVQASPKGRPLTHFTQAFGPLRHHLSGTSAPHPCDFNSTDGMNSRPHSDFDRFFCGTPFAAATLRLGEAEVWPLIVARRLEPVGFTLDGRPFFGGVAPGPHTALKDPPVDLPRIGVNDVVKWLHSKEGATVKTTFSEPGQTRTTAEGPKISSALVAGLLGAPPRTLVVPEQAGTGALQRAPIQVPLPTSLPPSSTSPFHHLPALNIPNLSTISQPTCRLAHSLFRRHHLPPASFRGIAKRHIRCIPLRPLNSLNSLNSQHT